MAPTNVPGTTGGAKSDKSTGSRSRSERKVSLDAPLPVWADYVLDAADGNNGYAEFPLRDENAADLSELAEGEYGEPWDDYFEALADEYEFLSIDDVFNAELEENDVSYMGTPDLISVDRTFDGDRSELTKEDLFSAENEDGELIIPEDTQDDYTDDDLYVHGNPDNNIRAYIPAPEALEVVHSGELDSQLQSDINTVLIRAFYDKTQEWANENIKGPSAVARLKVSKGRKSDHMVDEDGNPVDPNEYDGEMFVDENDRLRYGAFSVEQTSDTGKTVLNAFGASEEQLAAWNQMDKAERSPEKFAEILSEVRGDE